MWKAEEYKDDLVHNAFINGISSHSNQQSLFETSELTVNRLLGTARSLDTAQKHSVVYLLKELLPQLLQSYNQIV